MRVFAALPIPSTVYNCLEEVTGVLKQRYQHMNLVKPEGFHITLTFFGEISGEQAEQIMGIMDNRCLRIPRIKASLNGIGQFPRNGNPRVIYCRIGEGKEEVALFYNRFCELVRKNYEQSIKIEKDFIPHVTLARNQRERIDMNILKSLPHYEGFFTIDRIVLYQSVLKPGGAEYSPLKTVMFEQGIR